MQARVWHRARCVECWMVVVLVVPGVSLCRGGGRACTSGFAEPQGKLCRAGIRAGRGSLETATL